MKKGTIALIATAAAGALALAALKLLGTTDEPADGPERKEPAAPVDADETVAFPLKNKYADYSRGESEPAYIFELETPSGTKELRASAEQYDTYYIGDEVICRETNGGLAIV